MAALLKPLILSILLVSMVMGQDEDEETVLRVIPPNQAAQPGDTVDMECSHYPEDTAADASLDWLLPGYDIPLLQLLKNQSVINETQSSILRFSSKSGTLTIEKVANEDAGTYKCINSNSTLEVESLLKVYTMPTYFTEGMIVIGINIALLVIFFACAGWKFYSQRRDSTELKRKQKLGHKQVAKRLMRE